MIIMFFSCLWRVLAMEHVLWALIYLLLGVIGSWTGWYKGLYTALACVYVNLSLVFLSTNTLGNQLASILLESRECVAISSELSSSTFGTPEKYQKERQLGRSFFLF